MKTKVHATVNTEKISDYTHYMQLPLKLVACWDWFPNPAKDYQVIINHVYLCFVMFIMFKTAVDLTIHLYTEWKYIMSSLDKIADFFPLLISMVIIAYFVIYRTELYNLFNYMNKNFKYYSARGLTNMTMLRSYNAAKRFATFYTASTMFSVTMYATMPVVIHFWTKKPLQTWAYTDVTRSPFYQFVFLSSLVVQWFVGLAMGQLGVFYAINSILICGQLDILCCSLRNVRFTAVLKNGVQHSALKALHSDIQLDELHSYLYSRAEMMDSKFHYDKRKVNNIGNQNFEIDLYAREYDDATVSALQDCAQLCQIIKEYKDMFEDFVSPLLVVRVVQLTLYLCMLLYAATVKFDMITVEYLAAASLDTFVYCYFGNQIIVQADRVSTAAYQSEWPAMGVRPRRMLLNLLLANLRPTVMRAGRFLTMDLHTFITIIKTSFSYYTLLVNVNEKEEKDQEIIY